MMKALVFLLFSGVLAFGDDVELSAEEWKELLMEKYGDLSGYAVSYESVGENKRLDVRLAVDFESKSSAFEMLGERDGVQRLMRQWTAGRDVICAEMDGQRLKFSGLVEMWKHVEDVLGVFPFFENYTNQEINAVPMVLLDAENVTGTMGFVSRDQAIWSDALEEAEVDSVDADSVTFVTEVNGRVTIGREHGVILRQEVKGKEGEVRVLELLKLELNPGAEAVATMSAEWEVVGARELPARALFGELLKPEVLVQRVINAADEAESDELDVEGLERDRTKIWKYVAPMVREDRPVFELAAHLEFVEKKLRAEHLKRTGDPNGFEAYMAGEELRNGLRVKLAEKLLEDERLEELALTALFGEKVEFSVKTEKGEKARDMMRRALARGYCEEVVERGMRSRWGS